MSIRRTTYGLEGLYISDISGAGIPGCDWIRLGVNLEGTFTMAQEDTEETEILIEESDNPIVQILKAGKKSFTTSIPDLSFSVLQKLFGATKTENVNAEGELVTRVKIPDSAAYIFKSFKIVPKEGVEQIYFPKGQVSAKIAGSLTKDSTLNVELTVTALTPDYEGETAMMIDQKEGDIAGYWLGNTLSDDAFTNLTGVDDGTYDITVDDGTEQEITGVDFSTATSWDDIVTELNSSVVGATWSFNKEEYRFIITSDNNTPTDGSPSKIRITVGAGTDITGSTMLDVIGGTPMDGY